MHTIQKIWQLTIVYNGLDSVNFQHENLKKSQNFGCTSFSGSNVIWRYIKWVGKLITHIESATTLIPESKIKLSAASRKRALETYF